MWDVHCPLCLDVYIATWGYCCVCANEFYGLVIRYDIYCSGPSLRKRLALGIHHS